ncbi:hypothetical protein SADUNF_Sadunf18G0080100 [Salix dunnii]|uniref:Cation/H+ exchanger transmembrane domain-containing protein n=1 Tax=Salix dunnii TaxID=1413687 RepID=A0A835J420_9ROSI|nr:hypothetical protein SADUNF_Sadunf18G0080100 [Salix dunnii]
MGNFKGLPVLIWIEISLNQQRIDNSECQTECKNIPFRGKEIGLLGFVYFLFEDIRGECRKSCYSSNNGLRVVYVSKWSENGFGDVKKCRGKGLTSWCFLCVIALLLGLATLTVMTQQEYLMTFFYATVYSMSSLPVIVSLLDELKLLNSQLGRLGLSTPLVSDLVGLLLLIVSSLMRTADHELNDTGDGLFQLDRHWDPVLEKIEAFTVDVNAVINFLDASFGGDNPIPVTVIHHIKLVGQSSALFISHRKGRVIACDHLLSMNVICLFNELEQNSRGSLSVNVITAVSLPKFINRRLVNVAMILLEGDDDREALAFAIRIAQDTRVKLWVAHILPANLNEKDRIKFREEVVDGATTAVPVIRSMVH